MTTDPTPTEWRPLPTYRPPTIDDVLAEDERRAMQPIVIDVAEDNMHELSPDCTDFPTRTEARMAALEAAVEALERRMEEAEKRHARLSVAHDKLAARVAELEQWRIMYMPIGGK